MKIKSSVLFLLSSVFLVSCDVWAAEDPLAGEPEGERVALWPEGRIPGVEEHQYNSPFIEWFTPSNKTTDAVLVLAPGGGYERCYWAIGGHLSHGLRDFLLAKGMTVVRLHYRTPRPKLVEKHITAWQDAQRAVRLVRAGAAAHGVSPNKIGFYGYSAGGHLTLLTALSSQTQTYELIDEVDALPCNVNWAAPAYPAYVLTDNGEIAPEFKFDSGTCPLFLMHGDADSFSSMASVKVYEKLHSMRIPAEMHVFAKRDHDFRSMGSAKGVFTTWHSLLWEWLVQMGICRNTDWIAKGKGALVMSFDDRNFVAWENAAPLFRKYDARVTFFFCGVLDDQAKKSLRWLSHHNGHSIGLHGLGHRNADSAVASMGAVEYWTKEIVPQLEACRAAGLNITSFAYPNCQFTGETDELFRTNGFKHVRGGLLDVTPYDPKGEKRAGLRPVHTVDKAFIPAKELQNRFRLDTALVGESYNTDIEDILKCVRRCAERNEVFVLTSHGIAPGAKSINMKTEWLERILATAKECGVAVIGFDEL